MAKIEGAVGNVDVVRKKFQQSIAMGEGLIGSEFSITVEGYPDLTTLCQSAQFPEIARELIETYGSMGVMIRQQGPIKNAGEFPITFKEVIKGNAARDLRDWVVNKKYLDVTIKATPESAPDGVEALTFKLGGCWFAKDGTDLSVEDRTAIVKPSGTLHYNWIEPLSGR